MRKISRRTAIGFAAVAPATLAGVTRAIGQTTHEVVIANFSFSPAELDVAAGDIVRFVNQDGAPHTATANDGSFDTGRLNQGESAEVEIAAGEHAYVCSFHPAMKAVVRAS